MAKCCDITAGMLREPVTFQRQVSTDVPGGGVEVSYVDDFDTRCRFVPLSGNETFYAMRIDAQTRNRLTIRYTANLTESHVAVVRGQRYNIRYINNVEFRNRWLILDVDGGVAV